MTKHILRGAVLLAACMLILTAVSAQQPTPIPVQLATSTPLPILGQQQPTAFPTTAPTETPIGGAQLEALESVGQGVNVRADADPEAELLGLIVPGERFTITGRYFRWLQFRFTNAPSGLGWVYDELVQIHGDPSLIPDLSEAPVATVDPVIEGATLTAEFILNNPDGALTATAGARELVLPTAGGGIDPLAENALNPEGEARLPTFTPAPNVGELVAQANVVPTSTVERAALSITTERGTFPPILPIVALMGFGMLGLAVSFIRR